MWTKFIWFRIGTTGWLLWTRSWTFGYHTKRWISQAKQLLFLLRMTHITITCSANKCNDKRLVSGPSSPKTSHNNTNLTELLPHPECHVSHIMQEFLSVRTTSTGGATYSCHCAQHRQHAKTHKEDAKLHAFSITSQNGRRSSPPTVLSQEKEPQLPLIWG